MDLPIAEALRSNEVAIKTLDEDSSLEGLKYKEGKVSMYIKSIISGKHEIMKIATETGKEIKVTLEHPLVNENGAFVEAGAVEVGSYLMNEFGEAEKVVSVEKTEIEGKVYNLETEGQKMTDKVIAAQGLLNGDVRVQNSKAAKLNQVLLRTNLIPQELLK
jgi:intein/homing endonuclease